MAGFLNRSVSLMMDSNGSSVNSASSTRMNGSSNECSSAAASAASSPLKVFVLAKKRINDVFGMIGDYVNESHRFLNTVPDDCMVIDVQQKKEVESYRGKINGISEVLSRDHMKVAFFGRTSNGKSSVINAMLQEKILPSGIGHTTNCFLQVEGSETGDAYLMTDDSNEKKNVESVGQLANALCSEKLGESALVRIFWPKDKCPLLRDDVVLVDSPGIDVSPNLDEWIDKHCLDADVFVLVANAESTLMVTEKNFFHKVSERLSKPNIFILNNRWDASANEPEFLDEVRKQHLDRNIAFLVDELNVVPRQLAEDRVFFVSAKEVLQTRLATQKKITVQNLHMAEGFQSRYFEFNEFERKFEECISKSAVKTKFEQHTVRGKAIANGVRQVMDQIYEKAHRMKTERLTERNEHFDRLDFTEKQLGLLTLEMKDRITLMVEEVERKVATTLSEEIRRLSVLVDDFNSPFHPDELVLNVYKKELHGHVEQGLGSNLRARLSNALAMSIEATQKDMTERMSLLLPEERKQQVLNFLPRRDFEVLYRLNCDNLCADFREDVNFKFSLGFVSIMNRFLGRAKKIQPFGAHNESITAPIPMSPMTPLAEPNSLFPSHDDLSIISKFALASFSSQGAVGVVVIGGFLVRAIGWKVIVLTSSIYGLMYLYERLTWTNKAKERAFKQQYVEHATRKLRLIVDLTSANCSHQVQQELSSTFARLCHLVDEAKGDMEGEIQTLEKEIHQLEEVANSAKILRNKAGYLVSELDTFIQQYLQHRE
ncbi:hypothetical protein CHUAL_000699 [Chamberlinius hualienensis]